jgi:hypothetical protein
MSEFDFSAEILTAGISEQEKELHGALQSYFFLYLWQLRIIDQSFIEEASSENGSDPQSYEAIKTNFLKIIQEIPVAMIEPVINIYHDKMQTTFSKRKKAQSAASDQKVILLTQETFKESFVNGLSIMINNLKVIINSDLYPQIESSFDSEKDKLQKALAKIFDLPLESDILVTIASKVNDLYRNWAENKEQYYDEMGRARMAFLTSKIESSTPQSSDSVEAVNIMDLIFKKNMLAQYLEAQNNMLPLSIIADLQKIFQDVSTESYIKHFAAHQQIFAFILKSYINILEHANRFVFGAQKLSETDTTYLLKASMKKTSGAK